MEVIFVFVFIFVFLFRFIYLYFTYLKHILLVRLQLIEEERPSLALDRSQNGQASSISSQPSFSSSQVHFLVCDKRFVLFVMGIFVLSVTDILLLGRFQWRFLI